MEHSVVFDRSHGPGHRLEGRSAPLLRYRLGAQDTTFCRVSDSVRGDKRGDERVAGWPDQSGRITGAV
jgi:hypothetical protein